MNLSQSTQIAKNNPKLLLHYEFRTQCWWLGSKKCSRNQAESLLAAHISQLKTQLAAGVLA